MDRQLYWPIDQVKGAGGSRSSTARRNNVRSTAGADETGSVVRSASAALSARSDRPPLAGCSFPGPARVWLIGPYAHRLRFPATERNG
jgi:hypothetical protein